MFILPRLLLAGTGVQFAVRQSPAKQNQKQRPQKNPKPRKTQRGGRALLRPKTDRNPDQKPNQTDRPTDRTQYRTRAGSRHQTVPLNSHVCVGPFFSHVTCSRRAQGSNLSTLVARAIRDPKRAVGGSRWIPVRKIDHFLGLFFPVPSRVVCVRACVEGPGEARHDIAAAPGPPIRSRRLPLH